jgi:hypothetical protein
MLNHHLSQKLEPIEIGKFNHLIGPLTRFWVFREHFVVEVFFFFLILFFKREKKKKKESKEQTQTKAHNFCFPFLLKKLKESTHRIRIVSEL